MYTHPSFGAEADICKISWAYMSASCLFNATGARLSCDEATIHGAVEFVKRQQRSALQSDRSLSDAEKEIRLRQLDDSAIAVESMMRNAIDAIGLLK